MASPRRTNSGVHAGAGVAVGVASAIPVLTRHLSSPTAKLAASLLSLVVVGVLILRAVVQTSGAERDAHRLLPQTSVDAWALSHPVVASTAAGALVALIAVAALLVALPWLDAVPTALAIGLVVTATGVLVLRDAHRRLSEAELI